MLSPSSASAQDVKAEPYLTLDAGREPTCLAFSASGQFLLAGDGRGNVNCWDLERKVPISEFDLSRNLTFLSFLGGDDSFVGVSSRGDVTIVEMLSGEPVASFRTADRPVRVALDAGRRILAIANSKERIELFDLVARMPAGVIDARDKIEDALFLGFDRLGQQLVAITRGAKAFSWNPSTQRLIREVSLQSDELHGSRTVVHSAATNRAANILVVGLEEVALPRGGVQRMARPGDLVRRDMVVAYDWNSGIEVKRVSFPSGVVEKIELGPGSDHVAVLNDSENLVSLIDLRDGELAGNMTLVEEPTTLAVSEDDRWLASGMKKGGIAIWQLQVTDRVEAMTEGANLPTLSGRIRVLGDSEPVFAGDEQVVLAILPFDARGLSEEVPAIAVDVLSSQLANVSYLRLVERSRVEDIIDELSLQISGLTQEDGAELGKVLNADYVLLGSIGVLGTSHVFSARVLNVETAEVVAGRQIVCEECRDQDIYDAIRLLGTTIAR
jgi:WD40 repeat protein